MHRPTCFAIGALALGLLLGGCTGDDERSTVSTAGATLPGTATLLPDLSGSWRLDSTITANGCGTAGTALLEDGILTLDSAGTSLHLEVASLCGALTGTGEGDVDTSGVVSASSSRTLSLDADCRLDLEEILTGTLNGSQEVITGSATLKATPAAGFAAGCGAGYPCTIDSTFAATLCPPADCSLLTCP